MTELRRFGMGDGILLLVILAGAAGLRAGYLTACCQQGNDDGPLRVQDDWSAERDALVDSLRKGEGFVGRAPLAAGPEVTAHVSIGYPWLLAMLENLLDDRAATRQIVRWVQCGLGALTAALYFLFARRAFRSLLAGTLAGVLCALHPYWIINTAEIDDGVLVTFLLAWCIFLGGRAGEWGGALSSLLYGLGLAGLACTRAALLPFAFVAVLWFLYRCRVLQRGWLYAILAFLGFVNGLIPWTARNFQTFNTVVPIVDSTYLHLWLGANSRANGGPQSEETMRQALADRQGEAGRPTSADLEGMSQPDRYNRLGWEVLNEARENPARTIQGRLRSGLSFFFGEKWLADGSLSREEKSPPENLPEGLMSLIPSLLAGSLLGMLALGVLGWRWSFGWRLPAMPSSLAVIWILLPYLLGHAALFHGPRLPLDGVLLCYAGLAIACLVPGVGPSLLRGGSLEAKNT